MLPLAIDKFGPEFWYHGDTVWWSWKRKKWISSGFSGDGSFGDACFDTLKDLDKEWNNYFEAEKLAWERETQEYEYKLKNGLCTEEFCSIEGEHKKHD